MIVDKPNRSGTHITKGRQCTCELFKLALTPFAHSAYVFRVDELLVHEDPFVRSLAPLVCCEEEFEINRDSKKSKMQTVYK